jgi:hypothetical protein
VSLYKNSGWICPRCERVYAPDVNECRKCCADAIGRENNLPRPPHEIRCPIHSPLIVTCAVDGN